MSERRSHYRVQPRGLSLIASVTIGSTLHSGTVVDTSSGGARIAFSNKGAPLFRVGEQIALVFSGAQLKEQHCLSAVVCARRDNAEHRYYGFAFQGAHTPAPDSEEAPFNRRAFRRVRPPSVIAAEIQVLNGNARGALLRGTVVDLSGGGVSITLPEGAEERMRDVTEVSVTLVFPGRTTPETRNSQIRNRSATQNGTRYGLLFTSCPTELPGPVYEPAWDCNRCGERTLLATSHLHCPNCGASQGRTTTYFPDWDALAASDAHRYAGKERRCSACGGLFSGKARHCGGCGTHL